MMIIAMANYIFIETTDTNIWNASSSLQYIESGLPVLAWDSRVSVLDWRARLQTGAVEGTRRT